MDVPRAVHDISDVAYSPTLYPMVGPSSSPLRNSSDGLDTNGPNGFLRSMSDDTTIEEDKEPQSPQEFNPASVAMSGEFHFERYKSGRGDNSYGIGLPNGVNHLGVKSVAMVNLLYDPPVTGCELKPYVLMR